MSFDKLITVRLPSSVYYLVLFVNCLVCCSLACVKQHKTVSGCCGVRDKTAFVPLAEFDELDLLNGECLLRLHRNSWLDEITEVLWCRLQVSGGHGPTVPAVQQRRRPAPQPETPEGGEIWEYLFLMQTSEPGANMSSVSSCLLRACGWSEKPEQSKSPWSFCPKCSANTGRTAPSSEERKCLGLSIFLFRLHWVDREESQYLYHILIMTNISQNQENLACF